MEIASLRKEFVVFIVEREPMNAKVLTDTLQAVGYANSGFYPTLELALAMARGDAPHIILVDYEGFEAGAETFLMDVHALSPEILVILMSPGKQILNALQLVGRGLAYDLVTKPFVSTLDLIQKMDRAATQLYYQFESEQLREELEGRQPGQALREALSESLTEKTENDFPIPTLGASSQFSTDASSRGPVFDISSLNDTLDRFSGTKDLDQTVQLFLETISRYTGDTPVVYFKYVPSHMSLLFSQATLLPNEKFRGLGIDLKKMEATRLPEFFAAPGESELLSSLMKEVFKNEEFTAFAHQSEGETYGLFVVLGSVDASSQHSRLVSFRRIFEAIYKRNLTIKEKHALDILDPVTGVFNRRHFNKILDEEIARARRLMLPVTIMLIDLDQTKELNERIGFQQTDTILKTIAQLLRKTARANDIIARIGADEFACLLPHTAHMGGAVKAERFRRIIESTKIPMLESLGLPPVTISSGVSEYPSFCTDSESLLRSADEAMQEVKMASGNKVCLANPPPGFKMDFVPREIPNVSAKG